MSPHEQPSSWRAYGYGPVIQELVAQVSQPQVAERFRLQPAPDCIVRSQGVYASDGQTQVADHPAELPPADVNFIGTPTTDDGGEAFDYISTLLQQHKLVITAEKGSQANFYPQIGRLSSDFTTFAGNAAVGGGTRMLEVLDVYSHDPRNIAQLHVSPSGTFTCLQSAPSLKKGLRRAVERHYVEKAGDDVVDIINGELSDVRKKVFIILQWLDMLPSIARWQSIELPFDHGDLKQLRKNRSLRMVASVYDLNLTAATAEDDMVAGFRHQEGSRLLAVGFRDINRQSLFREELGSLIDAQNGLVVGLGPDDPDGRPRDAVIELKGPGASPTPTANTMLDDRRMLHAKQYGRRRF